MFYKTTLKTLGIFMNRYESYIYKKEIDWSALHEGISIPVSIQAGFHSQLNSFLKRGESLDVNLLLGDQSYTVKMKNQPFDEKSIQGIKTSFNSDTFLKVNLAN